MLDAAKIRRMGVAFIARFRIANLYRDVFNSPDGRKVLADLCNRAGLLAVSAERGDPYMTHFNDGKRALVLEILDLVRWDAEEVVRLAEERDARIEEAA